jgi:hypothetical protein
VYMPPIAEFFSHLLSWEMLILFGCIYFHLLLSCPVKFTHQTNHKSHNLDGDLNCDPFQTQVRQALRACKAGVLAGGEAEFVPNT